MNKEKDLSSINHDIKNIIMSIKAYIQLVYRKKNSISDKKAIEYIENIDKQTDKLIDLIKKQSEVITDNG